MANSLQAVAASVEEMSVIIAQMSEESAHAVQATARAARHRQELSAELDRSASRFKMS